MNDQTTTDQVISMQRLRALQTMANRLRRHSIVSTSAAGSGHPSTCLSCAEIISALFFNFLRYDLNDPKSRLNDRFVLSKGHAAPILWGALAEAGAFPVQELETLRHIDSVLEGHPTPRSPYVDVATGSLGQGLSNAVGMALASRIDSIDNRIYCLMGDGESAEGGVWEAAALASFRGLDNLTAILDVNRLGQSDPTMYEHDVETYRRRFQAFGWQARVIDGHDLESIIEGFEWALDQQGAPAILVARTLKGKGVSFMEDQDGWHGVPIKDPAQMQQALDELGEIDHLEEELTLGAPQGEASPQARAVPVEAPDYGADHQVATREAYGAGLRKLGAADSRVVVLDADTKNSTYSQRFLEAFPDRFIECYIAEQNMIGAAAGLASCGKRVFASSFACFLSRAFDFIRMAAISRVSFTICGSHAGISIGQDGPSQMALEDLAMMRSIANSTVLYPSDAVTAERLLALAAEQEGITYIRTTRPKTPILYSNDETFEIGGSKVLRSSDRDQATVVGAGITLHEALKAHDQLASEGIHVRIVDLYSVKPVDVETLRRAASETGAVITVEDHYPAGGLGEAVAVAVADSNCRFRQLAVTGLPQSGPPDKLLEKFGISANRIVEAVKKIL